MFIPYFDVHLIYTTLRELLSGPYSGDWFPLLQSFIVTLALPVGFETCTLYVNIYQSLAAW